VFKKWYISCVSLGTLVTCFTSYLWKSFNFMQICHLCFMCFTLPFLCRKIQVRTKYHPKLQRSTRFKRVSCLREISLGSTRPQHASSKNPEPRPTRFKQVSLLSEISPGCTRPQHASSKNPEPRPTRFKRVSRLSEISPGTSCFQHA